MNQAQKTPYKIEGSIPDRYPRGWFCIGASHEFTNEKPIKFNYFDDAQVGYRGEDGKVYVLDGYCPHMGAAIGNGKVKGNSVACPFHGWVWGSDGVCEEIAYAKKIPPKAVIKSWPVIEKNELVYIWFDPDGGEPLEDQFIAEHPWLEDGTNWSPWIIDRVGVDNNARELIDNMADVAHFLVVHSAVEDPEDFLITEFHNIAENHTYEQIMRAKMGQVMRMESVAKYYGPAYMIHTMEFFMTGEEKPFIKSMSLVMNVPTGLESFEFLAGFKFVMDDSIKGDKNEPKVKQAMDDYLETQRAGTGVYADLAIWKSKCTIDNPVLCDGDGPVARLRNWYEQYLVPVDQVPETIKERKVFEKFLGPEDQARY